MTDNNESDTSNQTETSASIGSEEATPVYQKPALRKYDQIEQVKPYGPSELEAG